MLTISVHCPHSAVFSEQPPVSVLQPHARVLSDRLMGPAVRLEWVSGKCRKGSEARLGGWSESQVERESWVWMPPRNSVGGGGWAWPRGGQVSSWPGHGWGGFQGERGSTWAGPVWWVPVAWLLHLPAAVCWEASLGGSLHGQHVTCPAPPSFSPFPISLPFHSVEAN